MGPEQLDRLLDGALAAYSRVEPRIGIEGRVLAHVASARRRRRWIAAGWSVSAIATLCVVGLFLMPEPTITIAPLPIHAETMPPPPRLPVEPAPLTREERAWMALGESGVLASVGPAGIEPLRIDELTIPPLESEGGE